MRSQRGRNSLLRVCLVLLFVGAGLALWSNFYPKRSSPTYAAIQRSFQLEEHEKVLTQSEQFLETQPEPPSRLFLMAGESAYRLGRFEEALALYDRVPESKRSDTAIAQWAAGEVTLQMKRFSDSIQRMEHSLSLDPSSEMPRSRLIYLLNLAGRRWEASNHIFELLRINKQSIQQLLYMGNVAKSVENEKELTEFLKVMPDDRMPLLGIARIRLRQGDLKQAAILLERVQELYPELVEAHVQKGRLLLLGDVDEIPTWNHSLPSSASQHPETWFIRGQWAQRQGQLEAAARCFAEATQLDPDHLGVLYASSQVLTSLNQHERAQSAAQRAQRIEKLVYVFERIMTDEFSAHIAQQRLSADDFKRYLQTPGRIDAIREAAQYTLELGRLWESAAWSDYGLQFDPDNLTLRNTAVQAQKELNAGTVRSRPPQVLVDQEWIHSLRLPTWPSEAEIAHNSVKTSSPNDNNTSRKKIWFEEVSNALDFTYFASRKSFDDGRRMMEFTGGGVGVLDYDRDGWPDVFFAQGCEWPPRPVDGSHVDALLRNRTGDGQSQFQKVTANARILENAFGQGVSVGDVNSDGFDDVYVCNFGLNQLWINQGDGTFRNGDAEVEPSSPGWTVSAAIADLNGDGLAEIYEANYVEGEDVATKRCLYAGRPRACSPLNFRGAKGRLLSPGVDGIFRGTDTTVISPETKEGNALGVLAMRLKDERLPSLFVANDQVANLLLRSEPSIDSPLGIRLTDRAMTSGVAYDGDGKAQACMGIASGDVDGNGTIDLLVTNYYDESNTLYLQELDGLFRDATGMAGLIAPSLKMLGFGAQFIDAQCDGAVDLVVLNGHVDDMSHAGVPFHMRAQFFLGSGTARFNELPAFECGDYFAKGRLGRSLALIDFNRDGKQDFVATEIDGASRLVRNESQSGNYLTLELVGTQSHRDAIGTIVTAASGSVRTTKQLVGGCGYMATNEKRICIGLGELTHVDQLEIQWPSGIKQLFQHVPANTSYLCVENRPLSGSGAPK